MTNGPAIRDVTLRDGLQLTGKVLDVDTKLRIFRELVTAGVEEIEVGSMARPDLVPSLANTLDVVRELSDEEKEKSWIWVATPRHVARALDAGLRNVQYCLSVSDAHNNANIGRDTEVSMAALPEALAMVESVGGRLQLCLATSFTCPFEGPVDPAKVLDLVSDPRAEGASDIVIADTLGQAVPHEVSALISAVAESSHGRRVVFHGHDTWGLGVANSLAAWQSGAGVLDAALGGLGGCPFAPGASGNTSTEDLVFGLRPEWLDPDSFSRLVRTAEFVTEATGEPMRSKAAQGARAEAPAFLWVLPPESVLRSAI